MARLKSRPISRQRLQMVLPTKEAEELKELAKASRRSLSAELRWLVDLGRLSEAEATQPSLMTTSLKGDSNLVPDRHV